MLASACALLVLAGGATRAAGAGIECGVASAVFSTNPAALETAVATNKLAFWCE